MPRPSKRSAAQKENMRKAQLAAIAARARRKNPMEPSIPAQQNPSLAKETASNVRDGYITRLKNKISEYEVTIDALRMELTQERSKNDSLRTKLLQLDPQHHDTTVP